VTPARAIVTKVSAATFAVANIIAANHIIAVEAISAIPVLDGNVWRVVVVRLQHAPHEKKELRKPAANERVVNRPDGITCTESAGLNVRMCHFFI